MSLEDKIGELTAAVNALTAALAHPVPTVKPFVPDVTHYPEAKAEVAPPKPQPSTKPEETTTTPSPAGSSNAIDYAQVAKAITDTFKVDRAKTIAALAKFGAAKGPQLKPEDYAAFLKELAA
jgi:hypothetical protein